MSKELKCFDRIKNYQIVVNAEKDEVKTIGELLPASCKEVEDALKDYEKILTAKKCFKERTYKIAGLPLLQTMEDEVKSLKALEIIKKIIKHDVEVNGNTDIPKYEQNEVITQEEYDLLKEVLL